MIIQLYMLFIYIKNLNYHFVRTNWLHTVTIVMVKSSVIGQHRVIWCIWNITGELLNDGAKVGPNFTKIANISSFGNSYVGPPTNITRFANRRESPKIFNLRDK